MYSDGTFSLQTVAVNRLVLHLNHIANVWDDADFRSRTGLDPPMFATDSFLGSIRASVQTLQNNSEDGFDFDDHGHIDHQRRMMDKKEQTSSRDHTA